MPVFYLLQDDYIALVAYMEVSKVIVVSQSNPAMNDHDVLKQPTRDDWGSMIFEAHSMVGRIFFFGGDSTNPIAPSQSSAWIGTMHKRMVMGFNHMPPKPGNWLKHCHMCHVINKNNHDGENLTGHLINITLWLFNSSPWKDPPR